MFNNQPNDVNNDSVMNIPMQEEEVKGNVAMGVEAVGATQSMSA